ncbi:MAG: Uncharacterized protein XD43_1264 [Thermococcales archaeon 44_46]|nr:MAG: Uncharacterized protein XD43_1264 [Thermococcales archaeon 44_46]HIH71907.1 site-specific integrase [Thermococcaceae archaeon]
MNLNVVKKRGLVWSPWYGSPAGIRTPVAGSRVPLNNLSNLNFEKKGTNTLLEYVQVTRPHYILTQEHVKLLFLSLESKGITKDFLSRIRLITKQFLNSLEKHENYYIVTADNLLAHLNKIKETYSHEYYRKHVVYIKKLLRIANIPLAELIGTKKRPNPDKTIVTIQDIKEFLQTLKKLHEQGRLLKESYDRLVMATIVCAVTGMRVSEFTRIKVKNINLEEKSIHLPSNITKTHQERITFFTEEARDVLKEFIKSYNLKEEDNLATIPQLQRPFRQKKELKTLKLRLKHMRKFFSQEWDRRNGNTTVKKLLMGHSLLNDINTLHYSHHSKEDLKNIYEKIMGDIKFLS